MNIGEMLGLNKEDKVPQGFVADMMKGIMGGLTDYFDSTIRSLQEQVNTLKDELDVSNTLLSKRTIELNNLKPKEEVSTEIETTDNVVNDKE